MVKYTIISGTRPDGGLAIKEAPNMTVMEAFAIAKDFDINGITNIEAKTGYPINCPTCGVLVDVHPEIEGFQKYCKVCETSALNKLFFSQM